ncbi:hypothetical protein [Paenibacillus albiflavus]|uniref:hypothetical protein n=1 Tax=Paenibacillus albiflavus TaxID=2545760 RepID=UPI001F2D4894|nr:hypothetical protein [Paenibacillus albiflavus]
MMKQHVRIKSFYGTCEKAVKNQVWIALIAFCLLVLVKMGTGTKHSLLALYRWLKALCWDRAETWLGRIHRKPSRSSTGRRKKA